MKTWFPDEYCKERWAGGKIANMFYNNLPDFARKYYEGLLKYNKFIVITQPNNNPTQQQLNLTQLRVDIIIKPNPPYPTQTIQASYLGD